ncbi:glutamine--fructose-6-phosphate transaminase (isomerizing) [Candidatus Gracilibacteria bacterium]|nr:glutamine--fructose-6-phosphate transaminase (isomerizing) [Candidatus Gracilibacteria bacterium]
MCGIFAYNGKQNAVPLLLDGLQTLEYRGYDSAGIFCVNHSHEHYLEKATGRVSNLASKVHETHHENTVYTSGIAHTRWATHGGVTEANTHPHYSNNERFFVVHNGIIENYLGIKNLLEKKYKFYSETDTEVIAKLIEDCFTGDLQETIKIVCEKLVGAYAIVVIDKQDPNTLIGAKLGSPMIIGETDDGTYISSDIGAISQVASSFISLEDGETVVVTDGKPHVYSLGKKVIKSVEVIDQTTAKADKGNFETFTEKEIAEVPQILRNVFQGRIDFANKTIKNDTLDELNSYEIENIEIIASGSSYFAGEVGKYWFRDLAGIPTEVRISSEFLYDTFIPNKKTLYIFLSQSGETADVRESVKIVQQKGCLTFGIVNTVGSTIARMCDLGLYTHCGIEVGVASTKNIVGQYGVLLLMAMSLGLSRDLQTSRVREIIAELDTLPDLIKPMLDNHKSLKKLAKKYSKYESMFFLGRNILYPVAAEGSLKLKELSYIHSECYSTGELKHGPLALINKNRPTIVLNLNDIMTLKTISNVKEIAARNGKILGVISSNDPHPEIYTDTIVVPEVSATLAPFVPLVPLWIFSVEVAKALKRDIDKPQNLAKSVTVE